MTRKLDTLTVAVTVLLTLTLGAPLLQAQASSKRIVRVTVTDPVGRFVTGLEEANFEVLYNGASRPISVFSGVDSSIAIAIVSQAPLAPAARFNGPEDELIQTQSLSSAVRQLSASTSARKALIVTTGADTQAVSQDIQVLQRTPEDVARAVIELRNQYTLQVDAATPTGTIGVVLKPPRGFPPLRLSWK